MSRKVYIEGESILTSLGCTTEETVRAIEEGRNGFRIVSDRSMTPSPVPLALVDTQRLESLFLAILQERQPQRSVSEFTRMEKMLIVAVHGAVSEYGSLFFDDRTLPVLSTTKGNIDLLEAEKGKRFDSTRVFLWKLAEVIRDFFGFRNKVMVVSNACISGALALSVASRQLKAGNFDRAVVIGGDILSEFVISGFLSFQALSPEPCKPFDAARNGLSLGEGAGAILLTTEAQKIPSVCIAGSATSNDANHISGPSRTGAELSLAIGKALAEAGILPGELDYISAHGTATVYNDEMESKSLALAGCSEVPVNSFKGYWGHTLGGAGILETALTVRTMRNNRLYRSEGFSETGVPEPVNVIRAHRDLTVRHALKTASGFGGCNIALVFRKEI